MLDFQQRTKSTVTHKPHLPQTLMHAPIVHRQTTAGLLSLCSFVLLIVAVSETFVTQTCVILSFSEHKTLPAANGQVCISICILF